MIKLSLNEIPTEKDCIDILKLIREEKGFICKKCKHTQFYWKSDKNEFECKNCKRRKSLKVDTLMQKSKLPIHYWVTTLDIILYNQCTITEIQSFFNIRYQTIHNLHQTISTQLTRSKVEILPYEVIKKYTIIELVKYFNDKEKLKIYLEFLSQPLIEYK